MEFLFKCSTLSLISERSERVRCRVIELNTWREIPFQEARVALGCALSNSHASLVISKLPACIHDSISRILKKLELLEATPRAALILISRWTHANQLLNSNWANSLSLFNSQRGEWWVYVGVKIPDCWAFRLFWTVPGFRAFSYSEKKLDSRQLIILASVVKGHDQLSFTSLTVHAYQTPSSTASALKPTVFGSTLSFLVNGAFSLWDQNSFAIDKAG